MKTRPPWLSFATRKGCGATISHFASHNKHPWKSRLRLWDKLSQVSSREKAALRVCLCESHVRKSPYQVSLFLHLNFYRVSLFLSLSIFRQLASFASLLQCRLSSGAVLISGCFRWALRLVGVHTSSRQLLGANPLAGGLLRVRHHSARSARSGPPHGPHRGGSSWLHLRPFERCHCHYISTRQTHWRGFVPHW